MNKKLNLICFGHLPWSSMWKRNQSIVEELSKKQIFNKILFLNPYVRLTDIFLKLKLQIKHVAKRVSWQQIFSKQVTSEIRSLTTIFLGPSQIFVFFNNMMARLYLKFILRAYCGEDFVLLINDFEPDRCAFYKTLIPYAKKVIVDISDDFLTFRGTIARNKDIKKIIFDCTEKADLVLCVNEFIKDKYGDSTEKYFVFENGIKGIKEIDNLSEKDVKAPTKHPIIGYVGVISESRVDEEIMEKVFTSFPESSIVFVGQEIDNICNRYKKAFANFHHIDCVPYNQMMCYISKFDVAIIPHKLNEHTKGNSLLKTYVYMIAKKPIVSTSASNMDKMINVVEIADDPQEFCNKIEKIYKKRDMEKIDLGYEIALNNTWDKKVDLLISKIFNSSETYSNRKVE